MRITQHLLGLLFLLVGNSAAAVLPRPSGYVDDVAQVLTPLARQGLSDRLQSLKRDSSIELAVVTVPSLEGSSIEEYAVRLFAAWGIGQKDKDNGVLVLVAPAERQMRIEVGYGMEAVLPDGLAGSIIREHFAPEFRRGDYAAGIEQGVDRIIEVLRRGELLGAEWQPAAIAPEDPEGSAPLWLLLPFFGLFVSLGFVALGAGVRQRDSFFVVWGAGFGGIPLVMSFLFVNFASPALPYRQTILPGLALLMFGIGLFGSRSRLFRMLSTRPRGGSGSSTGGSSIGGSSNSSSSNSSSDSGSSSSSFGGGSSGGGGASGRW